MTDVTDSLLGEHWTRASNVVVRKKTEEVKEEYSPHSEPWFRHEWFHVDGTIFSDMQQIL